MAEKLHSAFRWGRERKRILHRLTLLTEETKPEFGKDAKPLCGATTVLKDAPTVRMAAHLLSVGAGCVACQDEYDRFAEAVRNG